MIVIRAQQVARFADPLTSSPFEQEAVQLQRGSRSRSRVARWRVNVSRSQRHACAGWAGGGRNRPLPRELFLGAGRTLGSNAARRVGDVCRPDPDAVLVFLPLHIRLQKNVRRKARLHVRKACLSSPSTRNNAGGLASDPQSYLAEAFLVPWPCAMVCKLSYCLSPIGLARRNTAWAWAGPRTHMFLHPWARPAFFFPSCHTADDMLPPHTEAKELIQTWTTLNLG